MTFSESLNIIVNIQAVFGLTPFRYDGKTSKKFQLNLFNFIQSLVSYLVTSLSTIILTIFSRYNTNGLAFASTANLTIFIQDTMLLIAYNGAMINWLRIRKDHVKFLNKFNELGEKLSTKFKIDDVMILSPFIKKGYAQTTIIVYCIFLISNEVLRDIYVEGFKWSTFIQTVTFTAEIMTQILLGFYIGCLAVVIGQYFDIVFTEMSKIKQLIVQKRENKNILRCINLFNELICLKNEFSKLFGHQMLLLFLFKFVNLTISVYFILSYSVATNFSLSSIYLFCIFVVPQTITFLLLIHCLHKLGDVVSVINGNQLK